MDPVIVVGGGIAGVTCAKALSFDNPKLPVILISASPVVKMVANLRTIGRSIDIFDVIEQSSSTLESGNLKVRHNRVIGLDAKLKMIKLDDRSTLRYSKLCICTGAIPKIFPTSNEKAKQFIHYIRDTDTAKKFQSKLANSKRIVIVGNGGIATELVHQVGNCKIVWVIKDNNFGAHFFDSAVSKFFADFLEKTADDKVTISKRQHFSVEQQPTEDKLQSNYFGVALGPDWHSEFQLKGQSEKKIIIEKNCQVRNLYDQLPQEKFNFIIPSTSSEKVRWNVYVELSNGHIHGCDLVISATGVIPNYEPFIRGNSFSRCPEGGFLVDNEMRTNIENIYAAGDVCSPGWQIALHWFQMRLWTQARQMGFYTAKCVTAHLQHTDPALYFNFDVFTHVTNFFGFRVILLGLYNGQKLQPSQCSYLYRITEKRELIKVILQNGTMKGAVLIGDTDFEETFENLIYNQMDLSRFGGRLLDNMLDVEDFFD